MVYCNHDRESGCKCLLECIMPEGMISFGTLRASQILGIVIGVGRG
jgi:hypothetical protein